MIKISDLSITSLETIVACAINGGAFRFMLDELQSATIANTQENTTLTGRNGRTIGTLKRNKAVTVSGTNGMISLGLIAADVGDVRESENAKVKVPDYLVVESSSGSLFATTTYVAVGTVGNEIGEVYVKDASGVVTAVLEQASSAAAGKFAYDPETKKITFYEGDVVANSEITVYYQRQVLADVVIENVSDKYSEKLELYIDAIAEDKCHNEYRAQFYVPYADFTGNLEITMGDSQVVHNFEATSLSSACGNGSSLFWKLTVFGADAEDVTE